MRLPSFNDLTVEQRRLFLVDPERSVLVVGPPGSGKTTSALWKARILAQEPYRKQVVVVTKNRLLAALAVQISRDQAGPAVQSNTMSTFLTSDYWGRFSAYAPQYWAFNYKWPDIMASYEAANVQPSIDHLIVDEGQNLPLEFFIWARRFMAREMSVFSDENQTTVETGCSVSQLCRAGYADAIALTTNHRNTQEIADLVEHFHVNRTLPLAAVKRPASSDVPKLISVPTWESFADRVAARYRNTRQSIGVIVRLQMEVNAMHNLLRALLPGVRVEQYTSESRAGAEHAIQMREPGVTVITGESAIGLEFETVFLQDLWRSLPPSDDIAKRRLYMLCARARDSLILVNGPDALSAAQLESLPPPPLLER